MPAEGEDLGRVGVKGKQSGRTVQTEYRRVMFLKGGWCLKKVVENQKEKVKQEEWKDRFTRTKRRKRLRRGKLREKDRFSAFWLSPIV